MRTQLQVDADRSAAASRRAIGEDLRRLRQDAGLTRAAVARAAGIDASYLGDTWLIDHDGAPSEVELTPARPAARAGAELVTDTVRDRVLLFGGRDAATHYGDVWELTAP